MPTEHSPEVKAKFAEEILSLVRPLRYEPGPAISYGSADLTLWFLRSGGTFFRTEAICVRLSLKGQPVFDISFFGSLLAPEDLHSRGLSGNAGGWNLFEYQAAVLERSPAVLLPHEIELGSRAEWPTVFAKLKEEVSIVDASVWLSLSSTWEEDE
jgi:hypothetical protein